jgi:phosphotriesterase-related protein
MKRRKFLNDAVAISGIFILPSFESLSKIQERNITTVTGNISPNDLGSTLVHEHILVDFIGADQVNPKRYNVDEAFTKAFPHLMEIKKLGFRTIIECTPAYLGRDVKLLQRLSEASGLQIITNTGFYGAVQGKYLPQHVFEEKASQIAQKWIKERKEGIEGTGIYPGFIKTGVDNGPLTDINKKLIEAAALTHLETGLTISAHTGDGAAAMEEIEILKNNGVSPEAFRWVHAQNEKDMALHEKIGRMGAWVEFDGISPDSFDEHLKFVKSMKAKNLLDKVLISHDAGWYHVGEEDGGTFRPFTLLYEEFIPALQKEGFIKKELELLLVENPMRSFKIKVRKI